MAAIAVFHYSAVFAQQGQKYATGGNHLSATDKLGSNNHAPLRFFTNGSERARFSESGLLGIGTATPTATLDLLGSFRLRDGSQQAGYFLSTDANGNASWQPPCPSPATGHRAAATCSTTAATWALERAIPSTSWTWRAMCTAQAPSMPTSRW